MNNTEQQQPAETPLFHRSNNNRTAGPRDHQMNQHGSGAKKEETRHDQVQASTTIATTCVCCLYCHSLLSFTYTVLEFCLCYGA